MPLFQAYRATMCPDTGFETIKKTEMTIILPVMTDRPESIIAAIKKEITEVVAHVDEACSRVYTSGNISTPRCPSNAKTNPRPINT
jgi:hypothetical protein